jgi:transcriptional regulator with XRE-family HTH domain
MRMAEVMTPMLRIDIRQVRIAKKMAQHDLASLAGITREYLSALENGHRVPSLVLLEKLADALGVSITSLLRDQPKRGN